MDAVRHIATHLVALDVSLSPPRSRVPGTDSSKRLMLTRKRLGDRVLALLGLDFDFTFDIQRQPLSGITESLFVGCRPCVGDTPALKAAGITHVVSCLPAGERDTVSFLAGNFECLFVPVCDGIHEDIATAFPVVFDFAAMAGKANARAKLLVHCEVGVSRSAAVAIALVMKSENRTFLDAFSLVRSRRPEVLPNIGFASQLQRLEHALRPGSRPSGELSSLARYLREVCNVPADAALIEEALERHDYDALPALRAIFADELPRVIQGVRLGA